MEIATITIIVFVVIILILELSARKNSKKFVEEFMAEHELKSRQYETMSTEELVKLADEDLLIAVLGRIESKAKAQGKGEASYDRLSEQEQVVYITYDFLDFAIEDVEPGLRTYFGGVIRDYSAPRLSDSLAKIRAYEYKRVFDEFVQEHNIDLMDLSKFARCYEKEFKNQEGIYPFDEVDEKIHDLSGLEECIVKYIRENIECF